MYSINFTSHLDELFLHLKSLSQVKRFKTQLMFLSVDDLKGKSIKLIIFADNSVFIYSILF